MPIVDDAAAMMQDLEKRHRRVACGGETYCLVLVRLDDVQDDELTPQIVDGVGKRYSVGLRPRDSLYRFGPDMYLIGMSNLKPQQVPKVMDRLRNVVSDRLLTTDDGKVVPATVSLGATMLDSSVSINDNLERAGRALFAAAQNGGDSIRLWSADLELALPGNPPGGPAHRARGTE